MGRTDGGAMTDREYLKEMSKILESKLPDNYGFILFAFPFGDSPDNRMYYTSNANRKDAVAALKEWLIRASGPEAWMKHIQ